MSDTDPARELERLRRALEPWLAQALARPEPPSGLAAELLDALQKPPAEGEVGPVDIDGGADRYAVQAALTALTQEVKLEGRFFKQLSDTLEEADVAGLPRCLEQHGERLQRLERAVKQLVKVPAEATMAAPRELLEALCDAQDSLLRAAAAARAGRETARERASAVSRRSWLSRIFAPAAAAPAGVDALAEVAAAIEKGNALAQRRLESSLEQHGVVEIKCEGAALDPQVMRAVDIEETTELPEGCVLEVYRRGYRWRGKLLRLAEVKVARAPLAVEEEPNEGPNGGDASEERR